MRQEVIAAVPVRLSKLTLPSSSAALVPFVPVTVENSSVKLLELIPRMPWFWFVPLILMRRNVTFVAFSKYTPLPDVAPSAPVIPEMVPAVLLPPTAAFVPSPLTRKLPEVFFRKIPLGPPVVETLVSAIANGVVLLARLTSTPAAHW